MSATSPVPLPTRIRTDELRAGDRVWHPFDITCFTVAHTPKPETGLHFEGEPGLRVTGTTDRGETVHVDVAPGYIWLRGPVAVDAEQPEAEADVPKVCPTDLPQPVRDLFAAMAESLNVPLASTDPDDGEAAAVLLTLRATHVRILLESLGSHPDVPLNKDAADVRAHTERTPVTYRTFAEQKAADQEPEANR